MSYANCILYGASLPTLSSKDDKNKGGDNPGKVIDASDPRNNDRVEELIAQMK